jgi:hypothetical protein
MNQIYIMSDWQKGIATLDKNAQVAFSFRNGFSTYCDNLQLFKALGIYDQVERDVLRGFESARLKAWGIPNNSEDHGYYNRTERPVVTVISNLETDESDLGKTIVLQNGGKSPIGRTVNFKTSQTEFEKTVINVATSMEFNQKTNIGVESESSKFTASFSVSAEKQVTKNYSEETETKFSISTGEQLVKIKNPTQITKFKVRVNGKFCLNCSPKYNGHYLWMPRINRVYECHVIATDVGTTTWKVEPISDHASGSRFSAVGAE